MIPIESVSCAISEPTEIAKKIVTNPVYADIPNITVDGIVKETLFNDRYYLHTTPTNDTPHDLIVFYHGSRCTAWTQVLEYTNLRNLCSVKSKYLVAFGQASGIVSKPTIHPHFGYATFGEIFWEIRHGHPQLTEDIMYTRALVGDMKDQYQINNVYFIGHSNGGVFALLLTLYVPNLFTAIVSHMGGLGFDPDLYLNFGLMRYDDIKPPILFYTGENDLHKVPCEMARDIFSQEGFRVDFIVAKGVRHEYLQSCEQPILDWLESLNKL